MLGGRHGAARGLSKLIFTEFRLLGDELNLCDEIGLRGEHLRQGLAMVLLDSVNEPLEVKDSPCMEERVIDAFGASISLANLQSEAFNYSRDHASMLHNEALLFDRCLRHKEDYDDS